MKTKPCPSAVALRNPAGFAAWLAAAVLPWLSLCSLLLGCRKETGSMRVWAPEISGAYTLITVDGNPLPFTPRHEGGAPKITGGLFTIKPDGTCTSRMDFILPSGKAGSREVVALYTRDGWKLDMRWQGAGRTLGTVEGDIFTMDNEGTRFAFRK
jgi:hypothetical protein